MLTGGNGHGSITSSWDTVSGRKKEKKEIVDSRTIIVNDPYHPPLDIIRSDD
jgi:hypothetical protein